ncbi:M14 family zinc carboxypeptidase [Bacteroidota bacterium]
MKNLRTLFLLFMAGLFLFTGKVINAQQSELPVPEDYFGFQPGSDGNLFNYKDLIAYLEVLEKNSSMIKMEEIGTSPLGRKMYIAFISSEENISKLQDYKKINKELALNADLDESEVIQYVKDGKVFVLATLSMHSTEVAPSQSVPLIAYDLLTTDDPGKREWMDNVVYMIVPNHNPDGMDMIVDNYKKYKGSKYDGASLPDVYHKYVGHDNNRDFVILSQEDTKAIAAIYNQTWLPQVMVEKHQMGSTGIRYFVPPNHDPIAENVPGELFSWAGVFGQNMAKDMTNYGLAGVGQHTLFDDYWPGSTETCIWKNVIGFLTEAASVRVASPIYIEPSELSVRGKGLSEYKKSVNMLVPWEGGWWRLGDIVEYEIVSTMSILKTASLHKEEILEFRNRMCKDMVNLGKSEPPYYYIMPEQQHDAGELVNLVALLQEHGIETYTLQKDMIIKDVAYHEGDIVVPLAQPFRAFIKEVMEVQEYPERHYTPGGELIEPYDITSWSLPLHRQVKAYEIDVRDKMLEGSITKIDGAYSLKSPIKDYATKVILPVEYNESFKTVFAALKKGIKVSRLSASTTIDGEVVNEGSFILDLSGSKADLAKSLIESATYPVISVSNDAELTSEDIKMPRVALVETYFSDMDAGWTRYVFDTYNIPFAKVRPHEIEKAKLMDNYDVIIFPDSNKDLLMEGKQKSGESYYQGNYHPDYKKGIGKEGMEELMTFLDNGGLIISWGRSAGLFEGMLKIKRGEQTEEFNLPFRDISSSLAQKGLDVPGSLLKINLIDDHPLTLGMPSETGVFSRGRPVFRTSLPGFDMDRRVIASYPEKDIVLSGYAAGEENIGNTGAMIWMKKGEGQLVLFGFNPQFRASTQSSFKLLFNSLLL